MMVMIPKSEKYIKDPFNQRSISLLNHTRKLFETLILTRLNKSTDQSYSNFRAEHSTIKQFNKLI